MINPNPARLTLDGKILMQNPNEGEPVTVTAETFVTKGEHPIRYFTYCMYGSLFPDVTIENKEIGYKKVLGTAETRP
jgi:hypothetical protein